ncbi:hypothetical protein CHRY9293_03040 [Chryseobacterium potabilaquae]|uniref:Uncharacterized protein n=1 Tax=Chryseobacterium potabilaquae TaxID=2675057 RepID=A0A6N4XB68_9FLAO|nr:hypothetical protein CHRY9293_03040 [Chryseobacterium potabilaquae]
MIMNLINSLVNSLFLGLQTEDYSFFIAIRVKYTLKKEIIFLRRLHNLI